jgi:hypothetical protein
VARDDAILRRKGIETLRQVGIGLPRTTAVAKSTAVQRNRPDVREAQKTPKESWKSELFGTNLASKLLGVLVLPIAMKYVSSYFPTPAMADDAMAAAATLSGSSLAHMEARVPTTAALAVK